jgi:hypothetical protein
MLSLEFTYFKVLWKDLRYYSVECILLFDSSKRFNHKRTKAAIYIFEINIIHTNDNIGTTNYLILVFCEKMIVRLLLAIFVLIGSTQGAVSNIYFILILLILIFESKYRFRFRFMIYFEGPSWLWSYCSWSYNYLCN